MLFFCFCLGPKVKPQCFADELNDKGKSGVYQIRVQTQEGRLVAYFSIDNIDEMKKSGTGISSQFAVLPDHSVYIRQFYVDIPFQKQGVGTYIIKTLIPRLFPKSVHIYAATRKINEGARRLYEKCGFKESLEPLHGLSPERYISFEWHRS